MPFDVSPDLPQVDLELNLDEHDLPASLSQEAAPDAQTRIRALTEERSAAYRQMQRMMQDISQLRAREQNLLSARQGLMVRSRASYTWGARPS